MAVGKGERELTILIIDDNRYLSYVCKFILQEKGYRVLTTMDGNEGIKWVKEGLIDLVITDLEIPQLNGLEIVRIIRQFNSEIPIILMTAQVLSNEKRLEIEKSGINKYISKPFESKILRKIIAETLQGIKSEK